LARKALVAWKDGREARRAVADAVPFLSRATEVVVATVDPDGSRQSRDGVADVVAWLDRHGIKARGEILPGRDEGARLAEFAAGLGADLVVSGAYGHSRLREWVLGGVTRSLLDDVRLNRFMSA
jgi:nucleotide-binding universal stress UspA family protein